LSYDFSFDEKLEEPVGDTFYYIFVILLFGKSKFSGEGRFLEVLLVDFVFFYFFSVSFF
jgi:hypothetical protein